MVSSIKTVAVGYILLLGIFVGGVAHAQSDAVKAAREAVIGNLTDIQQTEGDTLLTPQEKTEKERGLKKTALGNLLTLSILETEDVYTSLKGTTLTGQNETLEPLREDLMDRLALHSKSFYGLRDILEGTKNSEGIRSLANQFGDRRESSYNADIKKAVELLLTLRVDNAIDKAYDRLEKLTAAVKKSKGTRIETEAHFALLDAASTNLAEAKAAVLAAHEELSSYLLPSPTAKDTKLDVSAEKGTKNSTEIAKPKPSIQELDGRAITSTKEGYKNFIDLNNMLLGKTVKEPTQ